MGAIRSRPWGPTEDDILRNLAACGKLVAAIAVEMNRSESAIRKRAAHIDVQIVRRTLRLWTTEDEERLRMLARSGSGAAEIAEQMNRSRSSVRGQADKLQIAIARERNGMQAPVSRPGEIGQAKK